MLLPTRIQAKFLQGFKLARTIEIPISCNKFKSLQSFLEQLKKKEIFLFFFFSITILEHQMHQEIKLQIIFAFLLWL